jgi:UDP-glucuronate 4-epimerase
MAAAERTLVTGALGCVGAWVVKTLVDRGEPVVAYDLGSDAYRLRLLMGEDELAAVSFVQGDITDLEALERVLDEHAITRVVHLAALQVPFCRADPVLGARVNVVGTTNVFAAVKQRLDRIPVVAYASSVAVYSPDGSLSPATHYGVYKLANEGTARIYAQDEGVPSVGIRPYVIYGPGRDQGLTSSPTQAMAAAARGEGFHITFASRCQYDYAPDVGRAFVEASRMQPDGAVVDNFPGARADTAEIVAAIEAAAPEVAGQVTWDETVLPFPPELGTDGLASLSTTPLAQGVRETIEAFRRTA